MAGVYLTHSSAAWEAQRHGLACSESFSAASHGRRYPMVTESLLAWASPPFLIKLGLPPPRPHLMTSQTSHLQIPSTWNLSIKLPTQQCEGDELKPWWDTVTQAFNKWSSKEAGFKLCSSDSRSLFSVWALRLHRAGQPPCQRTPRPVPEAQIRKSPGPKRFWVTDAIQPKEGGCGTLGLSLLTKK